MKFNFLKKFVYLAALGGIEKPILDNPLPQYGNILDFFADIPGMILTITGLIFMVVMLVGAYQYLLSAGKQESVEKAKNIFLTGLIGLVIILLAIPAVTWFYNNLK